LILDQIVTGLLTGLIYGLMALGLSVIFGVMRIVNFAHGEMAVVAMYGAWAASRYLGLDPLLALLPIALALFGAGYLLQRGLIQPFVSRPDYMQFILLISVALILTNGALLVFGPEARGIQVDYSFDSYEIGPLLIDKVRLLSAGAALALTGLLLAFFRFTLTGKAIRAAADNRTGAQVMQPSLKSMFSYGLLVLILLLRPQGLLGERS
jgi:branched-chain amino acid transport system permease protein